MDPQMITVLACAGCQREKSYGDDDLRDFVNLHYEGSQHPEAWQQQLKIMQATLEGRSKIGRAFTTAGRQRPQFSDAGLYLGEVWEAPIPNDNQDMFRTQEYIVRGLYRHDVGSNLPADCRVTVAHLDSADQRRRILERLAGLPHHGPTIKGHVVVWWVSYHPVEDPHATFWVLVFNDYVWFLGGTGALARPLEANP
jgi:hypothetical protein